MLMLSPMLMLKLMRRLMRVRVSVAHVCASASADMRARMRRHMYVPQRKYVPIMRMRVSIAHVAYPSRIRLCVCPYARMRVRGSILAQASVLEYAYTYDYE